MLTRVFAVIILAFLAAAVAADHHETSSMEEFKEFGNLLEGRWIIDVKLIADWPGHKAKKGERITGYGTYRWIVDGKAIEANHTGGTNALRMLYYWDGPSKKIKGYEITSGGRSLELIIWKKSKGVFVSKAIGGGAEDGRRLTGSAEHRFSDDGKTMTFVGSDFKMGDEVLDDFQDAYKKVSK